MTIDTDVEVELDVAAMKAGEPDVESLRGLFAELEFTSLLKELLPVVEVREGDYREIKSKAEFEEYLRGLGDNATLALAIPTEHTESLYAESVAEENEPQPAQSGLLDLQPADAVDQSAGIQRIAVSNAPGTGVMVVLEDRALGDASERHAGKCRCAEDDSRFQVCAPPFLRAFSRAWHCAGRGAA